MNDLMFDVETMGLSTKAALVGIGAVFFNEETGLGLEFYRAIHLTTAVDRGGEMDPGTVTWWLGQTDAARNAIRFSTYHIDEALQDLSNFITTNCNARDVRVWGCSPTFDCEKISTAMTRSGIAVPWSYFNERCYRTVRERSKSVLMDERTGLHNALEDAKYQALHLVKIRKAHRARVQS